jgi:hypothetical protein
MSTADERRRNTRVSFEATIDLTCGKKIFTGCKTENLSIKGVLVLGVAGLKQGDKCDLILHLSCEPEINLTMKGSVQRITDTGAGVQFTETDLDSFSHLKKIIYYNSENPDFINESY